MKLGKIIELLDGQNMTALPFRDVDVLGACGADLMSDVLASIESGAVLLTGLISVQTVRTAQMSDVSAIVFVRGKQPSSEIVGLAEAVGIPVIRTRYGLFQACGILYEAGLLPSSEDWRD